ncbi:MAG: arginine--tRNA ligase [Alphaproteobacteria bacterium]|nr:arginine--tRNA ligase [Alphaproteobacteria bacterium]MCB9758205.1 arginine--tRNA ligase [Alphaproteobacteria bacterium]MCB9795112.1 arginine--tRNA ligase [Alphaproteobacteria bacterium]
MATDLLADITAEISTLLDTWLAEQGAADSLQLGPPTRAGLGDLAAACHRYARVFRKAPQAIAEDLARVAETHPMVASAEGVNGFLNVHFDWSQLGPQVLRWIDEDPGARGRSDDLAGQRVLIEFSAPNTNKPQHLGHARNNLLGHTLATLLEANGADVVRINLINDRGIHICKSMVAYQRFGGGVTPESQGTKGDHLVGHFYVLYANALAREYAEAFPEGGGPKEEEWFNGESELGQATRAMLQAWEAGDPEVLELWRTMNGWCEQGFAETYARMGVRFDLIQKESETYAYGKRIIEAGLEAGVFYRLPDGAVAFDLAKVGREGKKIVLRADGTSLYVTQDIGTAVTRHEELGFDRMIYVVGNEQDYYFQVLFDILATLRPELAGSLVHRSYGMVELTTGKMKSRQGTVVDADDLMNTLRDGALGQNRERWSDLDDAEAAERAEAVAMAGLKYYLLRFNPDRSFTFDPESSISFQGDTGPYCQYAYARCVNILGKLDGAERGATPDLSVFAEPSVKRVLTATLGLSVASRRAAAELDPSALVQGLFDLAKAVAEFYSIDENKVVDAALPRRAALAALVEGARQVLGAGLDLLGMQRLDAM